jgi:FkbH-like protein
MASDFLSGLLVSDFNIQNLAGYLVNSEEKPAIRVEVTPFGQAAFVLNDINSPAWESKHFAVVWTRLEAISSAFAAMLSGSGNDTILLEREVSDYAESLIAAATRVKALFVPIWTTVPFHPGWGLADLRSENGIARALLRANSRLLELLDAAPNAYPLATDQWLQIVGEKAYNSRLWYLGKIPFGNDLLKEAAQRIRSALRGIEGRARKVVVLDLDETLWGGIVGEAGRENLVLGGHDAVGEAYVDFQHELKALTRRGVILAIVSKNDESVALDAIKNHPEMVLRLEDFAGWKINWSDKAENILALLQELNLGHEAAVFIDDNPVERNRVREAFPELLVPDWPVDKRLYPQALLRLDCFDKPTISLEDRLRPRMYTQERKRTEARGSAQSFNAWLENLGIVLEVEPVTEMNRSRVSQLLNKTNQMNLTTRRTAEGDLRVAPHDGGVLLAIRARDKFGDSGLVGVLGLERHGVQGRITDFVLSCRVMGRRIEESMLYFAISWACEAGLVEVLARYVATSKNKPCLEFFRRSGFTEHADDFSWDCARPYPLPEFITLRDLAHHAETAGGVSSVP